MFALYSGVNQLIVAVNKLDTVQWSQQRFDEIRVKLLAFLTKHAGFRESDITFVPCSGLIGDNLTTKPDKLELTKWYNGATLLEAIGITFSLYCVITYTCNFIGHRS